MTFYPNHPGSPCLSDDFIMNHNLTTLYSHCGKQLYAQEDGSIHIKQSKTPEDTNLYPYLSSYINNILSRFNFSGSGCFNNFRELGFDANRDATLFKSSEGKVRECAVKTLENVVQYVTDKGKASVDSVICLSDKHPSINDIPENIRTVLEVLYLNGITPYTHQQINTLLDGIDIGSTNIPQSLKGRLINLQNKFSKLKEIDSVREKVESIIQKFFLHHPQFHQLDREGWLLVCKHTRKMRDQIPSDLELQSITTSLEPWEIISKEVNSFILDDAVRSLMNDPACRTVTRREFTMRLSNLFSLNGVNMADNFPELSEVIKKLRIPFQLD